MSSNENKPCKPMMKKGVAVPSEVADLDFSERARQVEPTEILEKKAPLNPRPIPQGGPVPAEEILNREEKD